MDKIQNGLKWTFLINAILHAILGVLYTIYGTTLPSITGWPFYDPVSATMVGAVMFTIAMGSFYGWRETAWDKVRIVVKMEIIWLLLALLCLLWGGGLMIASWLWWVTIIPIIPLLLLFAVYFLGSMNEDESLREAESSGEEEKKN